MNIFGFQITRTKSHIAPVDNRGGWWPWIREPYVGAWQRNDEWTVDTVLAHHAVYACITLISSDIGKLRPKLVQQNAQTGIWTETDSAAFAPVLRRPNHYQNHIQFKEWWTTSKLVRGNAYVLKERDGRRVVRALHLLDPSRVTVLVAPDGAVFYQLGNDNLAGLEENGTTVPASEIIHDRMNCLFHPLVGISALFAAGMAANIGLNIERNSSAFFGNGSNPSGILVAPTNIDQTTADRIKEQFVVGFSGKNAGKIAVVGNNMKFEPLRMTAVDSQLIEQLKWTAETICSAFHVPPFKIGVGQMPTYQNGELLDQRYYSDCLQYHIESMEAALDEGLGLDAKIEGRMLGVELDLDGLLRMDTATQFKTLGDGISAGLIAPNEARAKVDLPPVDGGDSPYLQQQNFSLAALAERDRDKPFAKPEPAPAATPATSADDDATKAIGSVDTRWLIDVDTKMADLINASIAGMTLNDSGRLLRSTSIKRFPNQQVCPAQSAGGFAEMGAIPGGSEVMAGMSDGERAMMEAGGVKYRVDDEVSTGARSAKAYYDFNSRTIVVGSQTTHGIVAHETGHAIDNMMVGGGQPGKWAWSDSDAGYKAAVKADLKDAASASASPRAKEYRTMLSRGYSKLEHNREVFADLYATQRLGMKTRDAYSAADMAATFPRASAIVRDLKIGG